MVQEFKSHSGRVKWCAFTKHAQLLVSVSDDCTAKVTDYFLVTCRRGHSGSLVISFVLHTVHSISSQGSIMLLYMCYGLQYAMMCMQYAVQGGVVYYCIDIAV